ncbi:MAG: HipA domain-containing protein [Bdellovibrionales bacterium]|nr:HipA domain-containing protein [Bdellovibrionales bacterium]
MSEFSDLDLKKFTRYSSDHSSIEKTTNSFYHGRYRKYSAKLGSRQYILKVQESQYPDLPATEYVCNRIASLLGLNVPKYYLIRYQGATDIDQVQLISEKEAQKEHKQEPITFITRNFMQDYVGTLNHIYKYLPKGEKNYNCKNIINVLKEQTGKLANVERFIEICLFDIFIGNNDRHGRNLGIIDTGKSRKLAPMYDNPSFLGIQKDDEFLLAHFNPSGCIWTSDSKEPKLLDYIREFKKLKFEKPCQKFIKKIVDKFPLLVEEIQHSEIAERRKKAFIKLLTNRLEDCKKTIEKDFKDV